MKRNLFLLVLIFLNAMHGTVKAGELDFVHAANEAKNSVIYISVYKISGTENDKNFEKVSYASGTIVTEDGYVVTNYHVVNKGTYYQAVLIDGTEVEFERLKNGDFYIADERTDLAILKLKPAGTKFSYLKIANSKELKEGQWVLAIGNPYGLRHSITSGIISSLGRDSVGFAEIEDFIQTDVPINPGNSGGPLVDLKGNMVGINTAIKTLSGGFQGISFAIPSILVKKVFNDLLTYGRVRRGWLGLLIKEVPLSKNSTSKKIIVSSIMKKSPASIAGILKNDIVKEVDGVEVKSKGQLIKLIKNKPIGSRIKIILERRNKDMVYSMLLKEKRDFQLYDSKNSFFFDKYGIELSEDFDRKQVLISYISPLKSAVHENSLHEGDLILKINNKYIFNINQFLKVYKSSGEKIFYLEVFRNQKKYNIWLNN